MLKVQPFSARDPARDASVSGASGQDNEHVRNPGIGFDADVIDSIHVNRSAVERRVATLPGRRTVKKQWQAAWLLKRSPASILPPCRATTRRAASIRLCAKARQPVRQELLDKMGVGDLGLTTGAVCVYHAMVETAVTALKGSKVPVAAVSTGFPAGLSPLDLRIREIEASVRVGASEIDIVIDRSHVLTGNYRAVYDEMKAFREACGPAHVKAIVGAGDLGTLTNVARASMACMMAGADFIKTSTGKEATNASLPFALVMVRMIRDFGAMTGQRIGFKPAGGISTTKDALNYQIVMKEELGLPWLQPDLFRLGASSLLTDIERQLDHHVSGRYSAAHRHPMG